MKKILGKSTLLFLIIMLVSISSIHAEKNRDIKILEDINKLKNYFPCRENSESEKAVYNFIADRLDSLEINYYTESLDMLPDIHSFSSNIITEFTGSKDTTLILAVPVNNLYDTSFTIAQMLSLAENLKENPPEINCMIIFLGAEYTNSINTGYPVGSRHFLNSFFPENNTAVIYMDVSADSVTDIIHGSSKGVTPLWLLQQVIDSLTEAGAGFNINTQENILYQMGYDSPTPADIYLENNIPSISLLSRKGKKEEVNLIEKVSSFSRFLDSAVLKTDIKSDKNWDRHYFIIQAGKQRVIISEILFIIIYISIIVILIAFSVISARKVIRYSKKLSRYIWVLFYFFALIFLFLLLSTFAVIFITNIKSSYDIWKETPFYLLILKITIAALLFFLSLFLLKKIKLPVSGSFYSAAAIFIYLINMVIFQFMNINIAIFAIWGLLWTMLFSLFKSRLAKTICMFLSSVFIIYLTAYAFFKPAYNICEQILFDRVSGNILISFVILPYIMMIIRILISKTHIESAKYRALRRTIYSATALLIIFLLNFYLKSNPYNHSNPQPLYFSQTTDLNRKKTNIEISSPYKPGSVSFFTGKNNYNINTDENIYRISEDSDLDLITVKKKETSFLDRKNIVLEIKSTGNPEQYYIDFSTKESPVILDCNYPFTIIKDSRKGKIHIGKNPPSPLIIDMLLPEKTAVWFTIRTVSNEFPFDNRLSSDNKFFIQKFEVIKGTDG